MPTRLCKGIDVGLRFTPFASAQELQPIQSSKIRSVAEMDASQGVS
jgi:hypothetical protein